MAPFHPQWSFASDDDGSSSEDGLPWSNVEFEKRSPYPTVTLVAARVVEAAGEEVTSKIGEHNEQVLLDADPSELAELWKRCAST